MKRKIENITIRPIGKGKNKGWLVTTYYVAAGNKYEDPTEELFVLKTSLQAAVKKQIEALRKPATCPIR